jgi:transcriptional regulator with XRE-family HTH domain
MSTNQTVCRLLIGNALRRARESRELRLEDAAEHIGAKVSKVSRLELGQTRVTVAEVKMLLELYGYDSGRMAGLLALARGANQRGRWDGYRASVPEWFRMYADLEAGAEELCQVQVELVPGLLQVESYTRAVHAESLQAAGDREAVEDRIRHRLGRQHALATGASPAASFVLSESCLRRQVGDRETMRDQLTHLVALAELRHVQIQVLPFRTKSYVGGVSFGFTLLTLAAPGIESPLCIAYVESLGDARYADDKDVVREYTAQWRRLTAAALGPAESEDFIREVAEQYT